MSIVWLWILIQHLGMSLENVDSQWAYWKKSFEEIVESHAPTKKARVTRKNLPLISREICAMMGARSYFFNEVKKSRGLGEIQEGLKPANKLPSKS